MSVLQSIPSPTKIRDELEQMVLKELLGPAGGVEEEIDEQRVRDRYLVGMLAPTRQELAPEEFDELSQGGSAPVEDGSAEITAPSTKAMFPTMRYVLLHSLAHALIRQFAIECGYTTASIRERIYSQAPGGDAEPMAGILLYTAAPDSEGTLGGLVALGGPKVLGRHLDQATDELITPPNPIEVGVTEGDEPGE